jgi:hypothetical protein
MTSPTSFFSCAAAGFEKQKSAMQSPTNIFIPLPFEAS